MRRDPQSIELLLWDTKLILKREVKTLPHQNNNNNKSLEKEKKKI
jgi:hypothetical protein